jgi:Holliday junction resolvase RusA-like endonuclease
MKIILPLCVCLPRKKTKDKIWILNLNSYRNTHFQTLNQAKIAWKAIVEQSMPKNMIVECSPFKFTYTVFPASGRKFDLANVLSIVQKFTDDALVEYGVIPDDSYKIIPIIVYKFGAVDKENPRVELDIQSLRCDFDNLPF